ncbi:hypothetical protein IW262DRAFT_562136 [Armillaria fumosa]|nr:hypothetical protein IW262DRAFT_562136 [Armillaria fumosa]
MHVVRCILFVGETVWCVVVQVSNELLVQKNWYKYKTRGRDKNLPSAPMLVKQCLTRENKVVQTNVEWKDKQRY